MQQYTETAQDYVDVWNETDADKRLRLAQRVFAPDVRYIDPLVEVSGCDELLATIAGAQQQFPGFTFRLAEVDGHHQQLRFTWHLGSDGEEAPVVGFDVATLSADGRIQQVLGFLDRVPS